MSDYHQQFFDECRERAGDLAFKSVLVAGCGRGGDCRMFRDAGAVVTGLDVCEDIGSEFSGAYYVRQSIEGCNLAGDQFDVVFAIATMEHVGRIEDAYQEMARLVKPGGLVYSVAVPLWNSRRGHHIDELNPYPWIHLRSTPDEIIALAERHAITHEDTNGTHAMRDMMPYLFVSECFNRAPANRYTRAAALLRVRNMERNYLWADGKEDLTPAIERDLGRKGYTREELLATSHSLICRK